MRDAKIVDKDTVADSNGSYVLVEGTDALFQSAMLMIRAQKGEFVFDREFGSLIHTLDLGDKYVKEKAELLINEVLSPIENSYAVARELDGSILSFDLTINGETRTEEVQLNG